MSDSLRDQLMQAGFKEKTPAVKPGAGRSGRRPKSGADSAAGKGATGERRQGATRKGGRDGRPAGRRNAGPGAAPGNTGRRSAEAGGSQSLQQAQAAEVEQRRQNKAKIKALIEENRLAAHAGDSVYRFVQGSRIKQIFVTDDIRQRLIDGELYITRLNGSTHLIPPATGDAILAINPDWAMIRPGSDQAGAAASDGDDDYADYQVPDDLQW